MSKKLNLTKHSAEELHTLATSKREELRALRFSSSGSKNRDVKLARKLRREVARTLTAVSILRRAQNK
ncbi:50S ribosomal protein L29 [Candidatus Adlerbacteria bacterium RIFCSPHIGHO2_02_FULL_54_18]|uniref:Large ribosomal subunit protein uL29 n=2 Tax=Candidatus Adleribacteriota TaxID=1752736 RepID=A0A1F4Y1S6_9BACT|nr:MAG: 50S ribosomal protein L29 [Candidatus Adlerbacteria bacterium RIFCSPLOWO2_01_FULL_54_21b]OGC87899.1 MAG: 50S ribosomal protein L29 [Candidatus Adlerbacteria bacterium RIFCSPHIGHO2_02_FULL_54_18]